VSAAGGRRPAVRDTVLDIRAEVVTTEYTVIRLRCGACGHVREDRTEVYPPSPSGPPLPAIPRTLRCKQCGRRCRTDTAIMPEVGITW
jgi:hypothetical protein